MSMDNTRNMGDPRRFVPLDDAKREVVEKNLKWAYEVAHRMSRSKGIDLDVAISAAFEGMVRAAQSWTEEISSFPNYSYDHMFNRICLARNADSRERMMLPVDTSGDTRGSPKVVAAKARSKVCPADLADLRARCPKSGLAESLPERNEAVAMVRRAMLDLTDRQREACELRYLRGLARKDVAALMGITVQRVRQLLTQSFSIMREALAGLDL